MEETRFYIAETVLALESIHQRNYIHRCAQISAQMCSPLWHTREGTHNCASCLIAIALGCCLLLCPCLHVDTVSSWHAGTSSPTTYYWMLRGT